MTVYDFCSFLNENDLYEIRLNQHWDFVDKFIVVEVGETHTARKKRLNFDHARFEKYKSKIHYVTFDSFASEMPKYPELIDATARNPVGKECVVEDWTRCFFQDNYVVKVIRDLGAMDDDIVYASCLDEIIRENAFERGMRNFIPKNAIYQNGLRPTFFFNFYLYKYKVNLMSQHWTQGHYAAIMTEVGNFKKILPATIRHRSIHTHPHISNAGWHFSSIDNGSGILLDKIKSWAHSRDTLPDGTKRCDVKNSEEASILVMSDFKKPLSEVIVPFTEETHPKYLINNLDKFKDLIYKE